MPNTNRTLDITAKLRDQFSQAFKRLGGIFKATIVQSFLAPLRLLSLSFKALRTALTGFAVASVGAFAFLKGGQTVGEILATAQEMRNLAEATQTQIGELSALSNAFAIAGLEADDFRGVILDLQANINDALLDVNSPQAEGFGLLGVTLEQLRSEDFVTLLGRLADGVRNIGDESEQAAALFLLFPEDFQRLLPLLRRGSEGIRELVDEAGRFGGALNAIQAQQAESLVGTFIRLRLVFGDIARTGVIEGLSEIQPVLDLLAETLAENRGTLTRGVRALIKLFADLAVAAAKLAVDLLALVQRGIDPLIDKLAELFNFSFDLPTIELPFGQGEIDLGSIEINLGEQIQRGLGFAPLGPQDVIDPDTNEKVTRDTRELLDNIQNLARSYVAARDSIGSPDDVGGIIAEQAEQLRAELDGAAEDFVQARRAQLLDFGSDEAAANLFAGGVTGEAVAAAEIEGLANNLTDIRSLLGDSTFQEPFGPFIEEAAIARDAVGDVSKASTDWVAQFENGAGSILRSWSNINQAISEAGATLTGSALGGIEDAFSSLILGTKSVKEAFKDLAAGILQDIARLIPRLIILQSLQSLALLAEGGITGGVSKTLPIKTYARGGIADSPQLAIFGEAGEEAFVPLQGGAIPVRISGNAGGQFTFAPQITAMDAKSVQRLLIEQKDTISSIWQNEIAYKAQPRDAMRAGVQ